jgi:hypothetical protein
MSRTLLLLIFLFWFFQYQPSRAQTKDFTEKEWIPIWGKLLQEENLKFNVPKDFMILKGAFRTRTSWECSGINWWYFRVLISKDNSIAIGVQIYSHRDSSFINTSWIDNAKKIHIRSVDRKAEIQVIDKTILKDNWNAEYGLVFSRIKCKPFMGIFPNNKVVVIAKEDQQILIVYHFKKGSEIRVAELITNAGDLIHKL